MTRKTQKILAICSIIIAILFFALVSWFIGVPLLKFIKQPEKFRAWIDAGGFPAKLAFIGMVIFQVVVALIPGEPFEIAAGYAFGAIEGTILCIIASSVGSMIVFLLVRKFGVRLVEVFFSLEKLRSLKFLKASPNRDLLFLIVFMLPGTPKDLLCYFAGLTDISPWKWLFICSVGRIPSIVTSTIGGDALGDKNYLFAGIAFGVTLLISAAGLIIYNKLQKKSKNDD